MQQWHFRISAKVMIEGDNRTLNIHPENIATLIRVSDYQNAHMPTMQMRLRIDKNLSDLIIINAKTASLYLKIEKFDQQDPDQSVYERNYITYLEGEYSIFVGNDVNYNKELDYREASSLDETERKDVYQEINIGLISKECIEANKVASNVVFRETATMSMAAYFMQSTHLLLEPFTYNPTIKQLIVPPQETLYKTIKFLNEIKVFYDTSFLFFLDEPMCSYLISKSGNGIQKKDDIYLDVCFNINPKDDENQGVPGMKIDTQNNRYYADINVADSRYTIDHDSAKIFTKIEEIINPEIKNSVGTMDEIQSAITSVKDLVTQINNTANNVESSFNSLVTEAKGIANGLYDFKKQTNSAIKDFLDPKLKNELPAYINKFKELINKLPTTYTTSTGLILPLLTIAEKTVINNKIDSDKNMLDTQYDKMNVLNSDFGSLMDETTNVAYNMNNMGNNLGCFDPVNAEGGAKQTNKNINQANNQAKSVSEKANKVETDKTCIDKTLESYSNIVSSINSTVSQIERVVGSGGQNNKEIQNILQGLCNIKEAVSLAGSMGSVVKDNINQFKDQIEKYKNAPQVLNNIANNFNNLTSNIDKMASTSLTNKIKGIKTDITNIGKSAESALAKIKNIGKTPLNFNLSDLTKLTESLDAIGDLTGVGRLGRSSFFTKLSIGQGKVRDGLMILKTINDNSNKIKNIKSDIENQLNQLSINKYDLDPSVFTPNKRYTVKNYNGHQGKDGLFILNRKVEIYLREDDSFLCNTRLDLAKIKKD